MKRLFTILFSLGMLLAAQQAFGLGNTSYTETEELTPQEATTLSILWELEKYLRDLYLIGTDCFDIPEAANAAIVEQEHMDLLKALLIQYGLAVPVPGEEVGEFTQAFYDWKFRGELMWTGHRPHIAPCWHSEWGVFRNAIIYEEFSIWSLMQAIEQTDNQALIGAYSLLLVESSDHLRLFASLNPEGSHDPLFLSQETWDGIMAGTFPESTGDSFAINPGLNDAWYYPGTDGQGFFISVFPSLGTVSLAWFTFDTELPDEADTANLGAPGQRWLIATGPYQGDKATLDVVSVSGGLFDTSSSVPVEEVIGSVTLQFEDCNSGSISYEFPGISRSAEIPIERVAIDNVAVCLAY